MVLGIDGREQRKGQKTMNNQDRTKLHNEVNSMIETFNYWIKDCRASVSMVNGKTFRIRFDYYRPANKFWRETSAQISRTEYVEFYRLEDFYSWYLRAKQEKPTYGIMRKYDGYEIVRYNPGSAWKLHLDHARGNEYTWRTDATYAREYTLATAKKHLAALNNDAEWNC